MSQIRAESRAWCGDGKIGFILFVGQLRIGAGVERTYSPLPAFMVCRGEVSRTLYVCGIGLLLTISVAVNYGRPRNANKAPE